MAEKDLVCLIIKSMEILIKLFNLDEISLEVFMKNTCIKASFLGVYIENSISTKEKDRITQILSQYNKMIGNNTTAYNTQLLKDQLHY